MIEPATLMKLLYVAKDLRAMDRMELAATRDPADFEVLAIDAWASLEKYIALTRDGEPALAFGVRDDMDLNCLQPWGFGTDRASEVMGEVTKFVTRRMIPSLLPIARRAQVMVHPANRPALRWLMRLGFKTEANLEGIGSHGEDMLLLTYTVDEREFLRFSP